MVLAPGWSALVLESAGVPLNPMSATLGALVIAIATEFSVLLSARYHEERGAGASVGEALRLSYARTGTAVVASGADRDRRLRGARLAAPIQLLFGGDAIRMLTEFGLVAVVDLLVALAGVMLVLPAVLVGAESDFAAIRVAFPAASRAARPRPPARRLRQAETMSDARGAAQAERPLPLFVGIAFVVLIAYAAYNGITNDEEGLLGAEEAERGGHSPSSRSRTSAAPSTSMRTSSRTTARPPRTPAPRATSEFPPAGSRCPRCSGSATTSTVRSRSRSGSPGALTASPSRTHSTKPPALRG